MKIRSKFLVFCMIFSMLLQNIVFATELNASFIPENAELILFDNAKLAYFKGVPEVLENPVFSENGKVYIQREYLLNKLGIDEEITFVDEKVKNNVSYVNPDNLETSGIKFTYSNNTVIFWKGRIGTADYNNLSKLQGIYISPDGLEQARGDAKNPVNSLEVAKVIAERYYKEFGDKYPVYIFVHGGKYKFSETVTFDDEIFADKNKKGLKIVGYGDGEVIFTGAEEIDAKKLRVVKDANILARLPKAGRGQVASMKLSDEGINSIKISDKSYPFLYVDDIEQIQSRWPNGGFTQVKSLPSSTMMGYDENNPSRWVLAKDARINAYFNADYWFGTSKVASVNAKDKIITLDASNGGKTFTTSRVGARWYARNLLEEIDMPGEWFVDREENILYFYPPYSLKDKKLEIVTFHNKSMIDIGSSKNISVDGITFEKSGGEAIKGSSVDGVNVINCNFRYLQGLYALNFADVNMNVYVDSNKCYGCAGGFILCRAGKIDTLESGNTVISNNHISSCGYEPVNGYAAICITNPSNESFKRLVSVGIEVKNNVVQDCVTTNGLLWAGCYINIHHNEFLNQSKHLNDHGVIYVGRAHSQRGSEVAFNYIHDLNEEKLVCGLYNDDGYSGTNWHHNVCTNMYFSTTHGLGLDENYNYNLSVNCKVPGTVGSRMTWSESLYGENGSLKNEVKTALAVGGNVYKKAFPELEESLKRTPYSAPWNSCFFGNVGVNTGGKTLGDTAIGEIEEYGAKTLNRNGEEISIVGLNGSAEGNPHFDYSDDYFVDAANQNYNIKPESEIAKAVPELLEIKMEEMGLADEEMLSHRENFRLKEPSNGDEAVDSKLVTFSWDRVENATKYRLLIATDPEMQNIVYDKTMVENGNNNHAEVDSLLLDTVYYWKVQAIGLARQNQFVIENYNGPYIFRTARKNELDKENAEIAIEAIKEFNTEISKNASYEYDEVFLKEMNTLIVKAEEVYKNAKTQEELDNIEDEIYVLINKSPFYMKVKFEHLDGIFGENVEWTLNYPEKIYFKDGVLTLENSDNSTRCYATADINNRNSILCFKMKLDDLSDGSGWQGFDFKLNESGKGYFVTFKKSLIEFQRIGNGLTEIKK